MDDIAFVHAEVTNHAYLSEEQAHDLSVKVGFRFEEDAGRVMECSVRVRLMPGRDMNEKRLFRRGKMQAIASLRRTFAVEDEAPGNIFAC